MSSLPLSFRRNSSCPAVTLLRGLEDMALQWPLLLQIAKGILCLQKGPDWSHRCYWTFVGQRICGEFMGVKSTEYQHPINNLYTYNPHIFHPHSYSTYFPLLPQIYPTICPHVNIFSENCPLYSGEHFENKLITVSDQTPNINHMEWFEPRFLLPYMQFYWLEVALCALISVHNR